MIIGWPQGIILAMYLLNIGVNLANSARNKDFKWIGTIIGTLINAGLLTWEDFSDRITDLSQIKEGIDND